MKVGSSTSEIVCEANSSTRRCSLSTSNSCTFWQSSTQRLLVEISTGAKMLEKQYIEEQTNGKEFSIHDAESFIDKYPE